jgi:hypothetical protein
MFGSDLQQAARLQAARHVGLCWTFGYVCGGGQAVAAVDERHILVGDNGACVQVQAHRVMCCMLNTVAVFVEAQG